MQHTSWLHWWIMIENSLSSITIMSNFALYKNLADLYAFKIHLWLCLYLYGN